MRWLSALGSSMFATATAAPRAGRAPPRRSARTSPGRCGVSAVELGRLGDRVGQLGDLGDEVRRLLREARRSARAGRPGRGSAASRRGPSACARSSRRRRRCRGRRGPGCSSSGFFEATMTSMRSPASTSLTSWTERSWPIASGVSVSGSGTRLAQRQDRQRRRAAPRCAPTSTSRPVAAAGDLDHGCSSTSSPRATSIGTLRERASRSRRAAARCAGCRRCTWRAPGPGTTSAPSGITRRNGPKSISSCWYRRPSASSGRRWPAMTSSRPSISSVSSSGSMPASSACTTARGGSPW